MKIKNKLVLRIPKNLSRYANAYVDYAVKPAVRSESHAGDQFDVKLLSLQL